MLLLLIAEWFTWIRYGRFRPVAADCGWIGFCANTLTVPPDKTLMPWILMTAANRLRFRRRHDVKPKRRRWQSRQTRFLFKLFSSRRENVAESTTRLPYISIMMVSAIDRLGHRRHHNAKPTHRQWWSRHITLLCKCCQSHWTWRWICRSLAVYFDYARCYPLPLIPDSAVVTTWNRHDALQTKYKNEDR